MIRKVSLHERFSGKVSQAENYLKQHKIISLYLNFTKQIGH